MVPHTHDRGCFVGALLALTLSIQPSVDTTNRL
jgi:hypothetical protein